MPFTLLDIARRELTAKNMHMLVDEVTKAIPEVTGKTRMRGEEITVPGTAEAYTISGLTYDFPIVKSLPTTAFRNINEGQSSSDYVIESKTVETFLINPFWYCDAALPDIDPRGLASMMAESAGLNLKSAMQLVGRQFYYGRGTGDAKGHPGLVDSIGYSLDATGTTANGAYSVYAVKWGVDGARWVMGNNGNFRIDPIFKTRKTVTNANGTTGELSVFLQEMYARVGVHVGSPKAIGRIKNLTQENGKTLTDAHFYNLLALCDQRFWPDAFYLPVRGIMQLRASRTATNATGAPAPIPTEVDGIPLIPTDSLSITEAIS